ncbi:hypothetical protein MBLNU230_g7545t1 [Neophaeotheca triangularis]
MEDLLVREHQTEQHVRNLMKREDAPVGELLEAFKQYRQICQAHIFAVFATPEAIRVDEGLWNLHVEGKGFFKTHVKNLEKQGANTAVAVRKLKTLFLQFIKAASVFYREFIYNLNVQFSGIPELEAAARRVKSDRAGESPQSAISQEARLFVLYTCHQALVYLGDLSRYRAAEKLDKKQDYGPAMGYYELAAVICPTKGHAHHQASMVALSQERYMQAIYHLYRSVVVIEPHKLANKNLTMAFGKINRLWDKSELIRRNDPNEPDSLKNKLVGLFLRLHALCHSACPFDSYDEFEKTIHAHLSTELKMRDLGPTLLRLVLVNISAHHKISEDFQVNPTEGLTKAFFYSLRLNITTFGALLQLFKDDLRPTLDKVDDASSLELTDKVGAVMARVLPSLRVYSSWLLKNNHFIVSLAAEQFVATQIESFWVTYAKTLDAVTAEFPIWDLEDSPEVTYMLDEDVQSLGMLPLEQDKTTNVWTDTATGALKPKFSELGAQRVSMEEENLARIKDMLVAGLYLANDDEEAPIGLKGTRIYHGEPPEDPLPFVPTTKSAGGPGTDFADGKQSEPQKALSYAAAATRKTAPSAPVRNDTANAPRQPVRRETSRFDDMNRMVNQLVGDEDDGDDPVTPPQQYTLTPAIANTNGNTYGGHHAKAQDAAKMPPPQPTNYGYQGKRSSTAAAAPSGTPNNRIPKQTSSPWMGSPFSVSSNIPSDVPQGTRTPQTARDGHSRIGSATSIRSRNSQGESPIYSSMDLPHPQQRRAPGAGPLVNGYSFNTPAASPLLFGASNTMWSNGSGGGFGGNLRRSFGEATGSPPNGQGG